MRARAGTRPIRMPRPIRLRNRLRRTPTPSPSTLPVTSEPGPAGFRPRHSVKEPTDRFASRPSGLLAIRGARRTPSTRRTTWKTRWPSRPQAPYGWTTSSAASTRTRISSSKATSRRTWSGNRPVGAVFPVFALPACPTAKRITPYPFIRGAVILPPCQGGIQGGLVFLAGADLCIRPIGSLPEISHRHSLLLRSQTTHA